MSRKYLNVVSAGVMAFGTLALGLVTVLPMAGAANAVEDKGEGMYVPKDINGDPVDYSNIKDDDTDDDSNVTYNSNFYKQTPFEEGDKTNPDKTEPDKTEPDKTDPDKTDPAKTDPKGTDEKGGETTPATPATPDAKGQPDQKGADQGATKGADQKGQTEGQQHVKKGHHKFGAPNTGYEF